MKCTTTLVSAPLMLLLSLLPSACATITIAATGKRFSSHPDRLVGNSRWMPGYEYMARLETLGGDEMDLCPTSAAAERNWTISQPPDGLPVALLIRGDYCSDLTKAQMALDHVYPKGIVKYLIIYSTGLALPEQAAASDDEGYANTADSVVDLDSSYWDEHQTIIVPTSSDIIGAGGHSDLHIGVLHVNLQTGTDLLRIVMQQSQETKEYGGPRVLLDGNTFSGSSFLRNTLFWFGLSLMMGGCLCSFLLSMRLQMMDPPPQANGRPERRRLTPEQVDEWLPEMQLEPNDTVEHDHAEEHECSICLDSTLNSTVRKLPCQHVFHSECITKWLTERSATCPLCKYDLLPEEEEDDDDDESSVEAPIPPSAIFRLFRRMFSRTDSVNGEEPGVDQTPLLDDQDNFSIVEEEAEIANGSSDEAEIHTEVAEEQV